MFLGVFEKYDYADILRIQEAKLVFFFDLTKFTVLSEKWFKPQRFHTLCVNWSLNMIGDKIKLLVCI